MAWAVGALAVLAAYHGLRLAAARCAGAACDAYIPLSLLLPLLSWLAAMAVGIAASLTTRSTPWRRLLAACAVVSIVGPPASAVALRDSPDQLVALGTALVATAPVGALAHGLLRDRVG